jgi:hypothetical protein
MSGVQGVTFNVWLAELSFHGIVGVCVGLIAYEAGL